MRNFVVKGNLEDSLLNRPVSRSMVSNFMLRLGLGLALPLQFCLLMCVLLTTTYSESLSLASMNWSLPSSSCRFSTRTSLIMRRLLTVSAMLARSTSPSSIRSCSVFWMTSFFFRPTPDGSRQVVYQAGKTKRLLDDVHRHTWFALTDEEGNVHSRCTVTTRGARPILALDFSWPKSLVKLSHSSRSMSLCNMASSGWGPMCRLWSGPMTWPYRLQRHVRHYGPHMGPLSCPWSDSEFGRSEDGGSH